MSVFAFDTHRAVKTLCEAGGAEPLTESPRRDHQRQRRHQSRHHASEAAFRADVAHINADVANVRAELKTDIGLVRAKIDDLEARLYRQLWIMAAGIVGLTVALVKLLG